MPDTSIEAVSAAIDGSSRDDPRRVQPITVDWIDAARIGRISINGEYWAAVEWSEKRQAWCIEDAEGRCLAHKASILGEAASSDAAIALARTMIIDGRMPSPQQAHEAHARRREQRRQQPAQQRRAAERKQRREAESRAISAKYEMRFTEEKAQPLWEALHECFDFTDAELWKSNSFASLRPRLIVHLEAAVAALDADRIYATNRIATHRRGRGWRQSHLAAIESRLTKAHEILNLLRD